MQTTLVGAIALKENKNIFEKDGKLWASIDWIRLWPKNPRIISEKNLQKLKSQIKELGVYKPLVITPDGEILGGNMRYKVLKELSESDSRFSWIWVSVVEAWDDATRIKYALSDNFSAGEYTRDKLAELIKLDQATLFDDYDIDIGEKKSIQEFMDEMAITEQELLVKKVQKDLKSLGISEETIDVISEMAGALKQAEQLEDLDMTGKIQGIKKPIVFWFEDENMFEAVFEIFKTSQKHKADLEKLIFILERYLGSKIKTDKDAIVEFLKKAKKIDEDIASFKSLGESTEELEKDKQELKEKIKSLYINIFKESL